METEPLEEAKAARKLVFHRVAENLYRLETSGGYYALLKRGDKQFRRSLKTKDRKLADRRLVELRAQVGNLTIGGDARLSFEEVPTRVQFPGRCWIPRTALRVKEKADGFGLTVILPGVAKADLEITAEASQLKITGRRTWKQPEGWTQIHRESLDAPFALVLQHENSFDAEKAVADFRDGVLRLALPKTEALKPRKIKIG